MSQFLPTPAIKDTPFGSLETADFSNFIPTGSILPFMKAAGDTEAPEGWFFLDGGTFDTATNPKLARVFTTGVLPDLGGRTIMAAGTNVTEKAPGGANSVTLTPAQLPPHRHDAVLADGGHGHRFMHSRIIGGLNPGGTYIEISANEHGPPDTAHDSQIVASGTGAYVHSNDGVVSQTGTGATVGGLAQLQNLAVNTTPAHYGVSCYIIKGG